ncbi:MAG: SMP-30/gluconolactonase/LRE family protein [Gemmatimonadales bacterium]
MSIHPFPDWRHSLRRAVLAAALVPASATAQPSLPPDTVTTALDGDTIPRLGAVGGVAVDAAGFVYFADFRDRLWRYLPGKTIELVAEGLYGASGLAVGPGGEIYQSSFFGNSISRIARDGRIAALATSGLSGPVGIAVGGGGELYVCNCSNSTISRVDTTGRAAPFAAGALFACPNGIAIDDRGDLFVANYSNTTVVKITPDGTASVHADLPGGGGNTHIAFGNGGLYVTKYRSHQVFRVERDGTARLVAGTGARGADDGPALTARLSQPNGIAVGPNGRDLWFNELVSGEALFGGDARARLRRIRLVGLREVLAAAEPTAAAVEATYRRYRSAR